MTLLYALVRLFLCLLHPVVSLIAGRSQRRYENLSRRCGELAEALSLRVLSSEPKTIAERIAANCRDQAELGRAQQTADDACASCLAWQSRSESLGHWRTWLAHTPGPIVSMAVAYLDVALAVAAFALCGGCDPISLGVDALDWITQTYEALSTQASPGVCGSIAGTLIGLSGVAARPLACRLFRGRS